MTKKLYVFIFVNGMKVLSVSAFQIWLFFGHFSPFFGGMGVGWAARMFCTLLVKLDRNNHLPFPLSQLIKNFFVLWKASLINSVANSCI